MVTAQEKPTPTKGIAKTTGNVLIIEDDPDTATVIATTLIKEGYGARTVSTRDEAVKVLSRYLYDVIIMDLYMAGMGPDEFVKKAKSLYPRSKVILITAIESVDKQASRLGICQWIGKPFDPDQLLGAVCKCLS